MIKPFYAIGIFLYHLKTYFMALPSFYTPENIRKPEFSEIFRKYRKKPVA